MATTSVPTFAECALRIKRVRYGAPGKIHFDFDGVEVAIKEPSDVMLVGAVGASQWIARAYGFLLLNMPLIPTSRITARRRVRITARTRVRQPQLNQ